MLDVKKKEEKLKSWLPVTKKETHNLGWDELDVIIISGDAYVDHPAFGTAVIGRIIEREGLRVAIVPQPNWQDDLRDFKKLGRPKLFFGVTSGCMDSMVNHYTAQKRRRSTDVYTAGGKSGFRPDYAVTTYTKILKKLYPDIPVVIGGIEASLRRVTHYDYWSDSLQPSILIDSGADLLIYGMGEAPLLHILRLLQKGVPFTKLTATPQTAFMLDKNEPTPVNKNWRDIKIASHEKCRKDKKAFAQNFEIIERESNNQLAKRIIQSVGENRVIINPPFPTMQENEIDASFDLPYMRTPHPKYQKKGEIPAYQMIRHSINLHRGCFGGCSFCTISAHQGSMIASRSKESIMKEVEAVTNMEDFRGYISDLGGPSANMYKMKGKRLEICDRCVSPSCIYPVICQNLNIDHHPMIELYREIAAHKKVKKAIVSSGIRYDLLTIDDPLAEKKYGLKKYIKQVVENHVSGRLKVAPEHTAEQTLKIMRKPAFTKFYQFKKMFDRFNLKSGLNQQLIPYFISSHPGCSLENMAELAAETKELGFRLEQVQDFTPTPMTVATVIYYSGYHPYTMKPVKTAKSLQEKREQNRFFFWYKQESRFWINKVLRGIGREDLATRLLNRKKPMK